MRPGCSGPCIANLTNNISKVDMRSHRRHADPIHMGIQGIKRIPVSPYVFNDNGVPKSRIAPGIDHGSFCRHGDWRTNSCFKIGTAMELGLPRTKWVGAVTPWTTL